MTLEMFLKIMIIVFFICEGYVLYKDWRNKK